MVTERRHRCSVGRRIGALVGGGFTLWRQWRAAKARATRDEVIGQNELADVRRAEALEEVRSLFRAFVDLERDIEAAPPPEWRYNKTPVSSGWVDDWAAIWTDEPRSFFHAQGELIPDAETRSFILNELDDAHFTSSRLAPSGVSIEDAPLRWLVQGLAGEGVAGLGAYLRHDLLPARREYIWDEITKVTEELATSIHRLAEIRRAGREAMNSRAPRSSRSIPWDKTSKVCA